jgi:hypothetical protein
MGAGGQARRRCSANVKPGKLEIIFHPPSHPPGDVGGGFIPIDIVHASKIHCEGEVDEKPRYTLAQRSPRRKMRPCEKASKHSVGAASITDLCSSP